MIKIFKSPTTSNLKNRKFFDLVTLTSLISLLAIFTGFYGFRSLEGVIQDDLYILENLQMSNSNKIKKEMGIVYDLTKLIDEKTPENSRVLIPPQLTPYIQTGNASYIRYFIYPRYPVNGTMNNFSSKDCNYVLVVRGEGSSAEPGKYFWPKDTIEAEKVYYIKSNGKFAEYDGNYYPNEFPGIGGLIKLKNNL